MADFVAVIRRAVDGLADNSPDMRVKVYDKARGAVRRQLEAMNPRPSDDLVQRQLDKLEAAIAEVEGDHTEALPAEDVFVDDFEPAAAEAPPAPEPPALETPAPETPVEAAPAEPAPSPAEHEADIGPEERPSEAPAEPEAVVAWAPEEHPAAAEPAAISEPQQWPQETYEEPQAAPPHDEAHYEAAPVEAGFVEASFVEAGPVEPAPVEAAETVYPGAPAEAPGPEEPHYIGMQPVEPRADEDPAFAGYARAAGPTGDAEYAAAAEHTETPEHPYAPEHAAPAAGQPAAANEQPSAAAMPATAMPWEWSDERADADSEEIISHDVIAREQRPQDVAPSAAAADAAPEWNWPEDVRTGEPGTEQKRASDNAWGDLEDLIGYQPKPDAGTTKPSGLSEAPAAGAAEAAVRSGQRSFRAEPRNRKIGLARIGVAAAVLALVGGAGTAYWLNRDTISHMLADLTAPAADPSGNAGGTNGAGAGTAATGNTSDNDPAGTQVASADAGTDKFTQRLLPDGTETDDGPAPVAGEATAEEGKSVAEQSTEVASAGGMEAGTTAGGTAADGAPATATPTGTGTTGTPAAPSGTQTAATGAAAEQTPVGVAQKMFLYEERLGQSAPTAIDGTVAWSKAEETPGGEAKAEPVIRAQINVPGNGLAAQLTIRRNADKSLPASHLVEIVFALPSNFEGGSIDSVQRVAMKQTEQDRGDPLIAVPAKITEDFHMIALNDFPDAITRNAELLKNRDWIDIPITYRNGRRALLTLEKGTTGAEVFNSVMNAWAALGPAADSQ